MTSKTTLKELQAATSVADVAAMLGYKPRTLSYLLYHLKDDRLRYKTFDIPKRTGGVRTISAPIPELKLLQQRLNDLMLDWFQEIDLAQGFRTNTSHGFERKRSIITNAIEHRNRRHVFNLDLQDFFGSIHYGRVIGILMKDRNFKLSERVAKVLAGIACFKEGLPQGSPCSPAFANLVARVLDSQLRKLASENKCTYTRYADDITFSTNLKVFPSAIAVMDYEDQNEWTAGEDLISKIEWCGFKVNPAKTRMQYRDSRQEVTGLVVNRKVNVPSDYRKLVRAMVHSLVTKGSFTRSLVRKDATGAVVADTKDGTLAQLQGMLAHINKVDSQAQYKAGKHAHVGPITSEVMYRRFLMYKLFYNAHEPTIVCEGITDNIYLQHAIRSRAQQFPTLVSRGADGSVKLEVRFFRYPSGEQRQTTSTGKILGLSGGSSDLGNLLLAYREIIQGFHTLKNVNPVIVLIDNDDGAKPVFSILRQVTGAHHDRDEEFIHVISNLYVVATKRINNQPSKIEDFFNPADKKDLGHRKFNETSDPDPATEYGKVEFATKVVRPNAGSIDFSGFDGLLNTLVKVIQHRAGALAGKA
jgi:RNA-directed DNA polymerase